MVAIKEFKIPILFIPHCVMSFSFQLDSLDGILEFPILSKRIRLHNPIMKMANLFPWHNIIAIAFIFALHTLIPIISFLLKTFFKSMFVNLGLSQSKSALLSLGPSRMTLELSFIRA